MGRDNGHKLKQFMYNLAEIYPCNVCKYHIKEFLTTYEIPTSHKHFKRYLCIFHNVVNKRLNKPMYDCNQIV